ncbi:MAG: rhomboid family intramembrane serine protease [Desulfobacteraceae bacterium]|nr:rhomboid family intramembrane serine protease [Desulfobacteraceae bacterium]MCF8095615.1 rhomboid family intramembrane serine protease [Desulfobacteraceae bacterium]
MPDDAADLCGLILKASNIPFRVRSDGRGWGVWVQPRDYRRARNAVEHYFRENRGSGPETDLPAAVQDHGYAGIWAAALIAVVYAAVARTGAMQTVWSDFGASAGSIMDGEVYRIVTALFLHADSAHLLGNMVGLAVFATAVCHVAGWGAGIFMVLFAGAAGNLVNASIYETGHLSIGASTAVFGAVGILSGYQFFRKRKSSRQRGGAWLPLACGLALLGFLGTGEHVDLTAHLFGFMVGILAGIGYALANKTIGPFGQRVCLGMAAAVLLGAWAAGAWIQY